MHGRASRQCGFTYIGLLVVVAIMGLMLTVVSRVWSTTEQRERETQLLFIGHAYRMAISSYFALGHQYPPTLQSLLTDERFPVPRHHLRRLYADPMTGQGDWTLIMTPSGQGIMGVASSSQRAPIKRDGFGTIDAALKDADCYCAWQFVYSTRRFGVPAAPAGSPLPSTAPDPFNPGFNPGHISPPGSGGGGSQPGGGMPMPAPGTPVPQWQTEPH